MSKNEANLKVMGRGILCFLFMTHTSKSVVTCTIDLQETDHLKLSLQLVVAVKGKNRTM